MVGEEHLRRLNGLHRPAPERSAGYYSIFSIVPPLIITISVAGPVLSPEAVRASADRGLRPREGRAQAPTVSRGRSPFGDWLPWPAVPS